MVSSPDNSHEKNSRKRFDALGGFAVRLIPRRVGIPLYCDGDVLPVPKKNGSDFPDYGINPIAYAPAPTGGRAGVRGVCISPAGFSLVILRLFPQARAATVSAQVSIFVRIASSAYEVMLILSRPKTTKYSSPFGSRHRSVAE